MKFITILLISLSCTSCFQTNFRLTSKKISFNKNFSSGFDVRLIKVDSFGEDGFPAKYKSDTLYDARTLRFLDDEEIAPMLPEAVRREYLYYTSIKDSIIKNKIKDTLPSGDTLLWEDGSVMRRPPGIHNSIQWDKAHHKTSDIVERYIPQKKIFTFHFGRNTKKYRWRKGTGYDWYGTEKINGFTLIPGRWYTASFRCNYGLLSSGTTTIYFMADEKGNITCKRDDKENPGPF